MMSSIKKQDFIICRNCHSLVKNNGKKVLRCTKCGKVINLIGILW